MQNASRCAEQATDISYLLRHKQNKSFEKVMEKLYLINFMTQKSWLFAGSGKGVGQADVKGSEGKKNPANRKI